jgi:CHAD domain-containing protein
MLRGDEPAPSAAARIGQRLLEVIEVNLPGALTGTDSEFLHDLRVAVRRTRALQRGLRDSFPAEALQESRAEFRWLQGVTGAARDLDVYLLEFEALRSTLPERNRAGLDLLLDALRKRRVRERRRMRSALRSRRAEAALRGWEALLTDVSSSPGAHDAPSLSEVAGARINRIYGAMVKAGDKIDDASAPTPLHELRKQGKELRYLLEFFASLYPTEPVKPMVRSLKALQDSLGRFQDRQVQADLVRSLGEELRDQPDGVSALMTMGQLVERLDEQQAQARAEFAARFADFASRQHRALVREVFK